MVLLSGFVANQLYHYTSTACRDRMYMRLEKTGIGGKDNIEIERNGAYRCQELCDERKCTSFDFVVSGLFYGLYYSSMISYLIIPFPAVLIVINS